MSIKTAIRLFLLLSIVNLRVFAATPGTESADFNVAVWRGNSPPDSTDVTIYRTHSKRDVLPRQQQVCVQNGQQAWIKTGIAKQRQTVTTTQSGQMAFKTETDRAEAGFAIEISKVSGQRVKLKIMEKNQRPSQDFQTISEQKVATTLIVPLKRWVKLGGSGASPSSDDSTIVYTIEKSSRADTSVYVKITTGCCGQLCQ